MEQLSQSPLHQRLQRLLGYLELDPGNDRLREDAIGLACDVGDAATARRLLDERKAAQSLSAAWDFLEARVAVAEGDFESAVQQWGRLWRDEKLATADRAFAAAAAAQLQLRLGGSAAVDQSTRTLAPFIDGRAPDAALDEFVQAAWMRIEHHAGHLQKAMDWARSRDAAGQLAPEAAGVASLIALDLHDLDAAGRWASIALTERPEQGEAMLTAAALALVAGDTPAALALNERLAGERPADGRAWSQLGSARLLSQDLQGARVAYARATELMPGHAGSWHGLAWTHLLLGDLVEAERLLVQALDVDRNFAETHGALAVIYARTGRRSSALEAIRRARGLDASGFAAQYAQALLDQPALAGEDVAALAKRLLDQQQLPGGRLASDLLGAGRRS